MKSANTKRKPRAAKAAKNKKTTSNVPQWLEESARISCAAENFQLRRQYMLGMSIEECAEYMRLDASTIRRWESGAIPVPFVAFELLRLLYESPVYFRRHDAWAGWRFTQAGEFVSPDGTQIFTRERLAAIQISFMEAARIQQENTQLAKTLDDVQQENERLRLENIQLRQMAAADAMVDELHAIKNHVESLLATVDRAKVYQFPTAKAAA